MKRAMQLTFLMMSLPLLASAQTVDYSKGHGYAYFSPGVTSPSTVTWAHMGVGGEGFFTKYVGVGAEVGYLTPVQNFSNGIGTVSPNFVVRFRAKDEHNKLEPFATAGYTLFFRSGHATVTTSAEVSTNGSTTISACGLRPATTCGPWDRPSTTSGSALV